MKVLAFALLSSVAFPAYATTIDVSGFIIGAHYVGSSLATATALNFDSTPTTNPAIFLFGTQGPSAGVSDFVFRSPMTFVGSGAVTFSTVGGPVLFGSGTIPSAEDDAAHWLIGNDVFTEALTSANITRNTALDTLSVTFAGVVNDSQGLFVNDAATADFQASGDLAHNGIGSLAFDPAVSNGIPFVAPANSPASPEASTWLMMLMGFAALAGIGWRRSRRAA